MKDVHRCCTLLVVSQILGQPNRRVSELVTATSELWMGHVYSRYETRNRPHVTLWFSDNVHGSTEARFCLWELHLFKTSDIGRHTA